MAVVDIYSQKHSFANRCRTNKKNESDLVEIIKVITKKDKEFLKINVFLITNEKCR